jgi:hypothetical protein
MVIFQLNLKKQLFDVIHLYIQNQLIYVYMYMNFLLCSDVRNNFEVCPSMLDTLCI